MVDDESDIGPGIPAQARCAHLLVLKGPGVGDVHRLEGANILIGRDARADICLPHASVSRHHARLIFEDDSIAIEDLGSRNGTFVGIRRISQRYFLEDGDAIGVGEGAVLKLSYGGCGDPQSRWIVAPTTCDHYIPDGIAAQCALASLRGAPLSLVFFRVDAIASLEGEAVHSVVANEMMGYLALAIHETVRTGDILGKVGLDSFVAVSRSDAMQAAETAERVRARLSQTPRPTFPAPDRRTVTAVVVPVAVEGLVDPREVITAAKEAAGRAMKAGTNRVVVVPGLKLGRTRPESH